MRQRFAENRRQFFPGESLNSAGQPLAQPLGFRVFFHLARPSLGFVLIVAPVVRGGASRPARERNKLES